jgi:cyclopropane-fatty-acyl-phospholipid synthase
MNIGTLVAERGLAPDAVIRFNIRRRHGAKLRQLSLGTEYGQGELVDVVKEAFVKEMDAAAIAYVPEQANLQHYEAPPQFFQLLLGSHLKYSSGLWDELLTPLPKQDPVLLGQKLDAAEEAMLELSCRRAGLEDGMDILELGCGWGSLTLWMAEHYPKSRITAVSNSKLQIDWIKQQAEAKGLSGLTLIRADMNDFKAEGSYDRVLSVEMFEHMRNWRLLLSRIASWLKPEGKLFLHVFAHKRFAYAFGDGEGEWMGRNFFSGGMMPAHDLPLRFQDDLQVEQQWKVDGRHYERSLNAWLAKLDMNSKAAVKILEAHYGEDAALRLQKWRIFFMACAELFGYHGGGEWFVSHSLFSKEK